MHLQRQVFVSGQKSLKKKNKANFCNPASLLSPNSVTFLPPPSPSLLKLFFKSAALAMAKKERGPTVFALPPPLVQSKQSRCRPTTTTTINQQSLLLKCQTLKFTPPPSPPPSTSIQNFFSLSLMQVDSFALFISFCADDDDEREREKDLSCYILSLSLSPSS